MHRISVGICAHNEAKNVGNLIWNLLHVQRLDPEYDLEEIIVVSSGSTDGTDEVVKGFKDPRVRLISEDKRRGKSHAQNLILSEAKGEIIVLISADALPSKLALINLAKALERDVGGVFGRALPLNDEKGLANFASKFIWELHHITNSRLTEEGALSHLGGDMIAIKAGLLEKIPEEIVNDDAFIGMSIKRKGYRIVNAPDAIVFILGPATTRDYIEQRRRILYGHRQIKRYFGEKTSIFESLILERPLFSARIFVETCARFGLKGFMKVPFVLLFELTALLLSRRGDYQTWAMIRSTKGIIKPEAGRD